MLRSVIKMNRKNHFENGIKHRGFLLTLFEYQKIQNLIDRTKIYVEAEVPNVETNPLLRHMMVP